MFATSYSCLLHHMILGQVYRDRIYIRNNPIGSITTGTWGISTIFYHFYQIACLWSVSWPPVGTTDLISLPISLPSPRTVTYNHAACSLSCLRPSLSVTLLKSTLLHTSAASSLRLLSSFQFCGHLSWSPFLAIMSKAAIICTQVFHRHRFHFSWQDPRNESARL